MAEESLNLHRAAARVCLGQAPNALRLEVKTLLESWSPAVLHMRISSHNALVEAGVFELVQWVVFAWAAVALPVVQKAQLLEAHTLAH